MIVRVDPLFADELAAAVAWYSSIDPRLANRFRDEVRSKMDSVTAQPESHPYLKEPYRLLVIRKFPWAIIFRNDDDAIRLLKFVHLSTDPESWEVR